MGGLTPNGNWDAEGWTAIYANEAKEAKGRRYWSIEGMMGVISDHTTTNVEYNEFLAAWRFVDSSIRCCLQNAEWSIPRCRTVYARRPLLSCWANGDIMVVLDRNDAPGRSPCPGWHPGAETAPGRRAEDPPDPSAVPDRSTVVRRCSAGASRDDPPSGKPRAGWVGQRTSSLLAADRAVVLSATRCLCHGA